MIKRAEGVNIAIQNYLAANAGPRWERRQIPRPGKGSTLRRILDITHEQLRKTEEANAPTKKSN